MEFMGDAFLDTEEVGFVAGVPAAEFGKGEKSRYYDEGEGGIPAGGAATSVCWLGFGWKEEMLARAHSRGGRVGNLCRSRCSPNINGLYHMERKGVGTVLRKASKDLMPSEKPFFSPKALSSSPFWSPKPFMRNPVVHGSIGVINRQ